MNSRVRVWGWGAATGAALMGLEVALAAAVRAQGRLVLAPGPATLDEVIGTLAGAVALLLGGWLAVSSTAAVLAHAPGRLGAVADRLAGAWAPLLTRRIAAVLVGAAVGGALAPATGLAQEATPVPGWSASVSGSVSGSPRLGTEAAPSGTPRATEPAPGWSATLGETVTTEVAHASTPRATPRPPLSSASPRKPTTAPSHPAPPAGWTPSRPVQRPVATPDLITSGAARAGRREVVVHRGDTLWGLVAGHLGPDATEAEVAAAWPRWHSANRAVIGDDPDRLLPGQVLHAPTAPVSQ